MRTFASSFFFFFNDTATTEIYTLSLHDALPILRLDHLAVDPEVRQGLGQHLSLRELRDRSEEHTSELQSRSDLVCRLLLEKKKNASSPPYPVNSLASLPCFCCSLQSRLHAKRHH